MLFYIPNLFLYVLEAYTGGITITMYIQYSRTIYLYHSVSYIWDSPILLHAPLVLSFHWHSIISTCHSLHMCSDDKHLGCFSVLLYYYKHCCLGHSWAKKKKSEPSSKSKPETKVTKIDHGLNMKHKTIQS